MSESSPQFGILSCQAYVPRWRLRRETISQAIGWAKGLASAGEGERSFANWDEDSITMAVEAGREALNAAGEELAQQPIDSLLLASTSLPFADRSNAGVVREALNLNNNLSPTDLGGSRRAAISGLISILRQGRGHHLLCASECVDALPASETEQTIGHGSGAMLLGEGQPLARLKASASLHEDFVDQYRMSDRRFDYKLEGRWKRDAGIESQLQSLCQHVMTEARIGSDQVNWLLLPFEPSINRMIARTAELGHARNADELFLQVGQCGVAHPVIMLAWALEQAKPGDHILLVGAGQGYDVLLLEVIRKQPNSSQGFTQRLKKGRREEHYLRYLGIRRLVDMDTGIRSERDNRTAMSAFYRHHSDLTGFNGGRCSACQKLQFPLTRYCVHCHARESQIPEPMAGMTGKINSFTEDWLAYTARPPLMFGNIHFPDSSNIMMEFSDFLPGELEAGMEVRMSFRIKDLDSRRHFQRYFWKPTPLLAEKDNG